MPDSVAWREVIMPEEYINQELSKKDKFSVFLYRLGIGLTGLLLLLGGLLMPLKSSEPLATKGAGILLISVYVTTGISVLNIHLYLGSLKRFLRGLYIFSLALFGILLFLGAGNPVQPLLTMPLTGLLLLPLGGCIAFIGAKEAYCFNLLEGYLLAILIPSYILLWPQMGRDLRIYGLIFSGLLVFFLSLRKAVMPLSFDIGDKSKYVP